MASIKKRPNGKWRARYRDDAGREHSRHFDRKTDAQRWLDEVTTSIVTGQYVDPRAGKMTLRIYAERWRRNQPHSANTRDRFERELRLHVYPTLGDVAMARIQHSAVQALISALPLGRTSATNLLAMLRQVFRAAVRDRVIATDPTEDVSLPRRARDDDAWIPDPSQIRAVREALPGHFTAVVDLVVGSGLRPSEVFGLEVEHLDFARATVRVEQQYLTLHRCLAPPKSAESYRVIPLATPTCEALAAHLDTYPPTKTPVVDRTGPGEHTRDAQFVFLGGRGVPVSRGSWSSAWREPARKAGFPPRIGLHALRHFYASALIRHRESVKVVQRRLGHANAATTLATYTHLWPDSDDQTREAVLDALAELDFADSVRTDDDQNPV